MAIRANPAPGGIRNSHKKAQKSQKGFLCFLVPFCGHFPRYTIRVMSSLKFAIVLLLLPLQNSGRFDVKRLDTTCKPCEDFYQFVNGNWLKDNPAPAAYARWGTFQILQEDNIKILRGILE